MGLSRRHLLGGLGTAGLIGPGRASDQTATAPDFALIERETGGRLGLVARHVASGRSVGHCPDEAFPMCSTFKVLAAAAILARVDADRERLDRRVAFEPAAVVVNSPVTKGRAGPVGMRLDEICEAALTMSDNTAGNLLLDALGGPAGLTAYARSIGDERTRLDRIEPDLNEALPGDPRDTTTPAAMAANLERLVLGKVLTSASRQRLTGWLVGNTTGETRIRAGLPTGWRVGDKTGAGERGTTNDVAIAWPPGETGPLILAVYLTGSPAGPDTRNAALAAVARTAVAVLGPL